MHNPMKALSLFLVIVSVTQGSELDDEIKNDSKVHSALRKRGHRKLSKKKGRSRNDPVGNSNFSGGQIGGSDYVFDRAYTTEGIPVGTAGTNCNSMDTVIETGSNYQVTQSKCGFLERKPCTNPYTVSIEKKNDPRTSEECLLGTCAGCCREFSRYLFCDSDGQTRPWDPCVCSAGTYGGNPFSPVNPEDDRAPPISVNAPPVDVTPVDDRAPPISVNPPPVDVTTAGVGWSGAVGGTPTVDVTAPGPVVDPPPISVNAPSVDMAIPEICLTFGFLGFNQGIKPPVRPATLPAGLERGECTVGSHCEEAVGRCCLKNFCLCGQPDATRSNCMA